MTREQLNELIETELWKELDRITEPCFLLSVALLATLPANPLDTLYASPASDFVSTVHWDR